VVIALLLRTRATAVPAAPATLTDEQVAATAISEPE